MGNGQYLYYAWVTSCFLKAKSLAHLTFPTKRAPDVWEPARCTGIFLASDSSYVQAESTPIHTQVKFCPTFRFLITL